MACLLTWFGTFVCYDLAIHRLIHLPWDQVGTSASLVEVSLIRAIDQQVVAADLDVATNDPALGPGPALHQRVAFVPRDATGNARVVSLRTEGGYLCANPYGDIDADREIASDWEHFLIVDTEEIEDLLALLGNRWVLHRDDTIVEPAHISMLDGFRVQFGPLSLYLPDILPLAHLRRFEGGGRPPFYQADLFVEGWKLERVSLYRPLIYYTAFVKDAVYEQLHLSLQSLLAFGLYRDDVLILADRPREAVEPFIPEALRPRTHVLRVRTRRALGFMMARYRVAEWEPAARHQPLLYTDTDVVFDAPVAPMLARLARHRLISAPQEATRVAASPQLGRTQVEADGIAVGDRLGFNAGTLGFANLTLQGGSLRLFIDALTRFDRAQVKAGGPEVWEDQPMANYVAVKTGCVDTALLSGYVRFDHPLYRQGPVTSPVGRRGMVHFWGPPTYEEKRDLMQAYILALRGVPPPAADAVVPPDTAVSPDAASAAVAPHVANTGSPYPAAGAASQLPATDTAATCHPADAALAAALPGLHPAWPRADAGNLPASIVHDPADETLDD